MNPIIILKNLPGALREEIVYWAKKIGVKRIAIAAATFVLLVGGWFFLANRSLETKDPQTLSLRQAARVGEKATHKLLVQIEPPRSEGRYERGDVVMAAPADKQFSRAEQEGFLIIKIELTAKQAELLTLSLREKVSGGVFSSEKEYRDIKRRKFAVDLSKIGIGEEERKGRVIEDPVFQGDILYEKDK